MTTRQSQRLKNAPPAPQYVDIAFLGDRSGSMIQTLGPHALGEGVEKFCNEQRKTVDETGATIYMTIVTFDNQRQTWFDACDLKNIPTTFTDREKTQYCWPRGGTALIDTAIDVINEQTARIEAWMENRTPSQKRLDVKMHRIFAVYTDGDDTASYRYRVGDFHDLTTKIQEEDGADCFYLATGQDAIRMGAAMGFRATHTMTTGTDAAPIFRSLAMATQRASSGGPAAFTKMERAVSAPQPNPPRGTHPSAAQPAVMPAVPPSAISGRGYAGYHPINIPPPAPPGLTRGNAVIPQRRAST